MDSFYFDIHSFSVSNDQILTLVEQLQYVGFDHKKLFKEIFKIKLAKKMDNRTLSTHIQYILAIALRRGNVRDDQLQRIGVAERAKIRELKDLFKIKCKTSKRDRLNISPTTLTFVRFISLFPSVASTLTHRFPDRFCNSQLGRKFGSGKLPFALRHSGAAAMIPEGEIGMLYLDLHTGYMMELSLLINEKTRGIDNDTLYYQQQRFVTPAWTSNLMDNENRVKWFKTFGLHKLEVFKSVFEGVNELLVARGQNCLDFDQYNKFIDNDIVIFIDKETDSKIEGLSLPADPEHVLSTDEPARQEEKAS